MPRNLIPFAIAYDFDGTLASGNMQEHGFIPKIGMSKTAFWRKVNAEAKKHNADNILAYMALMLSEAYKHGVPVRKQDIKRTGQAIKLFKGVGNWFNRINAYGKKNGLRVEHYIISSGIKEMITALPIAKHFKAIFASSFRYDENGVADWPALVLNYTGKTQYLFRTMGREIMRPSGNIGLANPPLDESNPLRLNIIFNYVLQIANETTHFL